MTLPPTTIPSITAPQFGARIAAVFPRGWASSDAQISGNASFLFGSLGTGLASTIDALQYALAATRIQSATDGALDLCSTDYFGDALPRMPGESDVAFRARILENMLPRGATRAAVQAKVAQITGGPVRIFEPWQPADTGTWGGPLCYWGVDHASVPFRWSNGQTNYQGFVECQLPPSQSIGGNPFWGWNAGVFFWNVPIGAWINQVVGGLTGAQQVYDGINLVKVFGTVVWVKFVSSAA